MVGFLLRHGAKSRVKVPEGKLLHLAAGRDGWPRPWTSDVNLAVLAQEYERARTLALKRRREP